MNPPHYGDLSRDDLIEMIESMRIDPTYGILTRVALDAAPPTHGAVVFWDIDHMKSLNEQWGYQEVDRRIRAACEHIRNSECCLLVARWYSGDEFVLSCSAKDAFGAAPRIVALFAEQGIGITAGVAAICSKGWKDAATRASALVQAAKRNGSRGGVHYG